MIPRIIIPPSDEPISLELARLQCSIDAFPAGSPPEDSSFHDPWLETVGIPQAREYCEGYLGCALAPQTIEIALDAFTTRSSNAIKLPMGPIRSIVSVKYIDTDGNEQTLGSDNYVVDDYQVPGWLLLSTTGAWPAISSVVNAIKIRYEVGYDTVGESPLVYPLPKRALAAMLLMLAHLFANREAVDANNLMELPLGVQALLDFVPRERLGLA